MNSAILFSNKIAKLWTNQKIILVYVRKIDSFVIYMTAKLFLGW